MSQPIPVILCGQAIEVAEKVAPSLEPEIEVIRFFNDAKEAKENIPSLLAGKGPKSASPNQVGTHDYSKVPRAVIFGRAIDPALVIELHELCKGAGQTPVAWIASDPTYEVPPGLPPPGYGERAANTLKGTLMSWIDGGAKSDEIVYYGSG
ncbi:hypothetical protein GGR57DRAFT_482191 [Xylariaceae sp. FL1272]|nr:hypothetical protein GGR57DRAFT_482191 [Xylariaceae sp. FL1272]